MKKLRVLWSMLALNPNRGFVRRPSATNLETLQATEWKLWGVVTHLAGKALLAGGTVHHLKGMKPEKRFL